MKKAYERPQIVFENFTLSTNIASNCTTITNTQSSGVYGCGYRLSDRHAEVVFMSTMGCTTWEDDGDYNGICYHTPTDSSSLFTS